MAIHIGSVIQNYCISNHIRPVDLSRGLQINSVSLYKIFKRPEISTRMLLKVSGVLKHDFFRYYQESLGYNIYQQNETLNAEIQQLKKENDNLKLENNLLKKVLKME
jgi:hypothetical protein